MATDSYGALIKTTTTTTGTNDYVLATVALTTAHRTPKQAVADGSLTDGDTVQYIARDTTVTGDASFELGEGVYTDATNEIARDAANVHDGSNGPGALTVWPGSGVRDIYLVVSPSAVGARIDRENVFTQDQFITHTGNVLPELRSSDNSAVQLRMRTNSSNRRLVGVNDAGSNMGEIRISDAGIDLVSPGTVRLSVLSADGHVGMGVTPVTNLHVQENNTDTVPAVEIEQLSTGDAALQFSIVGDAYAAGIDNTDDSFKISYASSAGGAVLGVNDRLILDSTGLFSFPNDVMFGSTSVTPDGNVHIHSGSAGSVTADSQSSEFIIESNASTFGMSFLGTNTSTQRIVFADVDNNQRAFLEYQHSADQFSFRVSNTPAGILDENGFMIGNVTRGTARLKLGLSTQDLEIVDAGTVGATEDFWVEVTGAGSTFFLRGFTTK